MLDVLEDITKGNSKIEDIDFLKELAIDIKEGSLCGLGQTAPNPILTTIRYFHDEYHAHIAEKRCPAGICKALIAYYIIPEKCQACLICLRQCPVGAIRGGKNLVSVIDQEKCTKCGACIEARPSRFAAIVGAAPDTETAVQVIPPANGRFNATSFIPKSKTELPQWCSFMRSSG
jgi:NADH-quinone oxidoreductase subunit F